MDILSSHVSADGGALNRIHQTTYIRLLYDPQPTIPHAQAYSNLKSNSIIFQP